MGPERGRIHVNNLKLNIQMHKQINKGGTTTLIVLKIEM